MTSPYDTSVFLNEGNPIYEWTLISYVYHNDMEDDCDIVNFRAEVQSYDTVYLDYDSLTYVDIGDFIHDNRCEP